MSYDNWKTTDTNDNEGLDPADRDADEPSDTDRCEPYIRVTGVPSGGCLREYIDVLEHKVRAAFGKQDADGYLDPESGYDGLDWHFEDAEGNFYHLYARYGMFRVGALTIHVSDEAVAAFCAWVKEKTK